MQTLLAVAFWVAVWQGLAVCIGHNGLFLATPLQTVQTLWRLLPTADFWHRVGFSTLRILTGFVLAVTVGLLLGACGARWRWFGTLVGPVMQLIRAMPVASFVILALLWVSGKNLSVIVSFTHVLPVVYAGTVGGIADTDPALLEMAKVYRLPLGKRLRYIWLPGMFPSFCESCIAAMGMCWKSGVSAEVIGLPDHSVGDALYRAESPSTGKGCCGRSCSAIADNPLARMASKPAAMAWAPASVVICVTPCLTASVRSS